MRKTRKAFDVIEDITAGKVAPVYLIYGEEVYWHRALTDALIARFTDGAETLSGDETQWEDLRSMLSQPSFFGPRMWVIRDAHLMQGSKQEPGIRVIAPGNCLVLSCPVKDSPLSGRASGAWDELGLQVIEAAQPSYSEAVQWVSRNLASHGLKLTGEAAENLVSITGRSIERLNHEAEKIRLYLAGGPVKQVTPSVIAACVSADPEKTAFGFVDAVAAKDSAGASSELAQLQARGVNPIMLIAMLSSHFVLLWRAKEYARKEKSQGSIEKALGVHPYSARKALRQSRQWTFSQLEEAVFTLCRVDQSIKSGLMDPSSGIQFLVLNLCNLTDSP